MNETITQNDTRTMVEDNHFRVVEKLIKRPSLLHRVCILCT